MRYGFYTPNFDFCGDARILAELASEAERAGWDGFFIWDHLQFGEPTVDPWIALAAMAMCTERIVLGPLVTPVPRRHIAKLAREVITLDHLSGGRVVLGAGAGYAAMPEYAAFGDDSDAKTRASKLDEGLHVLSALLSAQPVEHHGTHFDVVCDAFQPPVQQPRVPIWIAASWPSRKPMDRASRWDGVVPTGAAGMQIEPDDLHAVVSHVREIRGDEQHFDFVSFGQSRGPSDTARVQQFASAGATWWLDYIYTASTTLDATRTRIRQGPPRL